MTRGLKVHGLQAETVECLLWAGVQQAKFKFMELLTNGLVGGNLPRQASLAHLLICVMLRG